MPPVRVRLKSGWSGVVEAPPGASDAESVRLAKEQEQREQGRRMAASRTIPEPDIVGRTVGWLTREPGAEERTLVGRGYPGMTARAAGETFLPHSIPEAAAFAATLPIGGGIVTAPLKRIAASTVAGTLADWVQRGKVSWSEASRFAASQGLGEFLPFWLRYGLTQRAGRPVVRAAEEAAAHEAKTYPTRLKAFEKAEAEKIAEFRKGEADTIREARAQYQERAAAAKRAFEEAETARTRAHKEAEVAQRSRFEAETEHAKAAHAQALREYGESGAEIIADSYKAHVPSWGEFPSTEAGLVDMVYGRGPERLSAMYDPVMQEIARQGRGVTVRIPLDDARALKLRGYDVIDTGVRGRELAQVAADQLAEAVTGKGKSLPGVYRRAVGALDEIEIGGEFAAARAEYKAGQALIQFTDKSQMLKGRRFNPDAAEAAFTMLKKVDELRRRGMGSAVEGPIREATQRPLPELRLPAEPPPLTPPPGMPAPIFEAFRRPPRGTPPTPGTPPAEPTRRVLPPGVTTYRLPKMAWWQGAIVAEAPFLIEGLLTGPHGGRTYLPWAAGALAAHALSEKELITGAPLSAASRFSLRVLPPALAQEAREKGLPPPVPMEFTNVYRP